MKRDLGIANVRNCACYTSPRAPMSASFGRTLPFAFTAILIFSLGSSAQEAPNPFTTPATLLINQVMERAGSPGNVTLDVANRSQLSAADVAKARKAIETQLKAMNVRLVKPERATAEITVTISENPQGLLWIAEVKQGAATQTIMLQSDKAIAAPSLHPPSLTLRRIPVYAASDDEPIIDFVQTDARILYVLHSQNITAYKWDGARWSLLNAFSFDRTIPTPRDTHGHIVWQPSQLIAYLPGLQCTALLGSDGLLQGTHCREIDDPWPLDNGFNAFFSSSRNFFSGIIRGANFNSAVKSIEVSLPPFYSGAAIGENNASWLFTGTDGRARLYSSFAQAPRVYSGWGSEVASLHSECGSQWQLIVSAPGDRSQTDTLQAMELPNGEPVPVSEAFEISGSVTSMWRNANGTGINVVSRNPNTKRYEASIFSVDCR